MNTCTLSSNFFVCLLLRLCLSRWAGFVKPASHVVQTCGNFFPNFFFDLHVSLWPSRCFLHLKPDLQNSQMWGFSLFIHRSHRLFPLDAFLLHPLAQRSPWPAPDCCRDTVRTASRHSFREHVRLAGGANWHITTSNPSTGEMSKVSRSRDMLPLRTNQVATRVYIALAY